MLPMMSAPNVHDTAIGMIRNLKGDLLDLGCGSGIFCEMAAERYPGRFRIVAADFNTHRFASIPRPNDVPCGQADFTYTLADAAALDG